MVTLNPMNDEPMYLRRMTHDCVPRLALLSFCNSGSFWTQDALASAFSESGVQGYVVDTYQAPVGFVIFKKNRPESEIRIIDLIVHSDHQRKGVATSLLNAVKKQLYGPNACYKRMAVEVCDANLSAHLFLNQWGLKVTSFGSDSYVFTYDNQDNVSRLFDRKVIGNGKFFCK